MIVISDYQLPFMSYISLSLKIVTHTLNRFSSVFNYLPNQEKYLLGLAWIVAGRFSESESHRRKTVNLRP